MKTCKQKHKYIHRHMHMHNTKNQRKSNIQKSLM